MGVGVGIGVDATFICVLVGFSDGPVRVGRGVCVGDWPGANSAAGVRDLSGVLVAVRVTFDPGRVADGVIEGRTAGGIRVRVLVAVGLFSFIPVAGVRVGRGGDLVSVGETVGVTTAVAGASAVGTDFSSSGGRLC